MTGLVRPYWIEARFERGANWNAGVYPFNLPVVRGLDTLAFHPRVTFLVGENGSGKSTLIEALAVAWGFNAEGGSRNFNFSSRASHSALHAHIRPIRSTIRPHDGYFLRAESFFNIGTAIEELDREPGGTPIINSYGDRSLHEQSHGEAFFALFDNRFRGDGLYILDEPEAALSPTRQLSFLARLHELVLARSQFIIATHSPILLGYPDAWIYQASERGLERVEYEDTEHFQVTRSFLNRRQTFLDVLLSSDDEA
ncbi:AAA family ATPase [Caulobacter sp. D4A]|uniref:AAA family ATPase n=1 Tax=unclassified Caulobacter TaxID=2648921 RepID=UPI000D7266DA|nr:MULTISPECIES: AAA family ATPase [unclassified Caulobacter]PXA82468.1 AAA family ATPase [Caulobacter sp. D4A]PXA95181.1 AAA family ATPase [Caulobacter sp. D5]